MSTTTMPDPIGMNTLFETVLALSDRLDRALQMPCPNCGYVLATKSYSKCLNVNCDVHGMPL